MPGVEVGVCDEAPASPTVIPWRSPQPLWTEHGTHSVAIAKDDEIQLSQLTTEHKNTGTVSIIITLAMAWSNPENVTIGKKY